jgi:hypothetical protein
VAAVLKELALYCSVDRIYVADNQAPTRLEARAVVLHMRSAFHKRDTMVKVKQYLARHQVRDAAVRDCFPSSVMEVARNLNRFGGHLKRNQGVQRHRVIADRDGHPVLQTAKQGSGYADHPVSVAEMEAFLANLGANVTQPPRQTTKGKTGPNHRAKNSNSGRQQLPSANHVPQGAIRQSLHLTQTANYGGQMASAQPLLHQQQPASAGPDYAAQRSLQDQHIQQQIIYQQQTGQHQQPHPHPLQMVQQQFPALRPAMPQPGTDTTQQYGGQWPHAPAVITVNSMPYTSLASSAAPYGQSSSQILNQASGTSDGGHQLTSHSGHEANTLQDGQHSSNRNG